MLIGGAPTKHSSPKSKEGNIAIAIEAETEEEKKLLHQIVSEHVAKSKPFELKLVLAPKRKAIRTDDEDGETISQDSKLFCKTNYQFY